MDQRLRLAIFGVIALLILAGILALVYYLGRSLITGRVTTPQTNNSLIRPRVTVTPTPSSGGGTAIIATPTLIPSNAKIFQGNGFSVQYPSNWGLLTCGNSANFEFDPYQPTDQRVRCDVAQKPVTVLVNVPLTCSGETIQLGSVNVVRQRNVNAVGDVSYKWCTSLGGKTYEFSHRVSASGGRAKSRDDFSQQVEGMISSLSLGSAAVPTPTPFRVSGS